MIIVSHPTGNANVRQVTRALVEAGLLQTFWTSIALCDGGISLQSIPWNAREILRRRSEVKSVFCKTRVHPVRESMRLVLGRMQHGTIAGPIVSRAFDVDAIYRSLDRRVAEEVFRRDGEATACYAYEDGARDTFRAGDSSGCKNIYDLPIAYWKMWRDIMLEEEAREPEWASTLQGVNDSSEKRDRKEEELRRASVVVVASSFTKRSLAGHVGVDKPVEVAGYGCPPTVDSVEITRSNEPIRLLFVGALTQRKGLSYLFRAVDAVKSSVELTVVGRKQAMENRKLDRELEKHVWIESASPRQVLEQMRRCHVFLFPSLFEGFGLVLLEAMSQGMAVITTGNTGGPDVIEHGKSGFIAEVRSVVEIVEILQRLILDREYLHEIRCAALRAAQDNHWGVYRGRIVDIVRKHILPEGDSRTLRFGLSAG